MERQTVTIFSGAFGDRVAACAYSEPTWQPEPAATVSDEEYAAWEASNPAWALRDDLGLVYLDSDLIETIIGEQRWDYLRGLLAEPNGLGAIRAVALPADDTLVLVFSPALGGFEATLESTPRLRLLGVVAVES